MQKMLVSRSASLRTIPSLRGKLELTIISTMISYTSLKGCCNLGQSQVNQKTLAYWLELEVNRPIAA